MTDNALVKTSAESLVPTTYAEKAMASLLQLHSELMEEKERRVDLYRRLMEKEQSIAELKMYVKLLEEKVAAASTDAAASRAPTISQAIHQTPRTVTPVAEQKLSATPRTNVSTAQASVSAATSSTATSIAANVAADNSVNAAPISAPPEAGNATVNAANVPPSTPAQAVARSVHPPRVQAVAPVARTPSAPMDVATPRTAQPLPRVQSAPIPGPAFPRTQAVAQNDGWKAW